MDATVSSSFLLLLSLERLELKGANLNWWLLLRIPSQFCLIWNWWMLYMLFGVLGSASAGADVQPSATHNVFLLMVLVLDGPDRWDWGGVGWLLKVVGAGFLRWNPLLVILQLFSPETGWLMIGGGCGLLFFAVGLSAITDVVWVVKLANLFTNDECVNQPDDPEVGILLSCWCLFLLSVPWMEAGFLMLEQYSVSLARDALRYGSWRRTAVHQLAMLVAVMVLFVGLHLLEMVGRQLLVFEVDDPSGGRLQFYWRAAIQHGTCRVPLWMQMPSAVPHADLKVCVAAAAFDGVGQWV
ncbi:hypothetical protein Nepgr_030082 [Nepenthes gracilis]|uniref:Uncharacterized protein n=1 Tax=Nepenthes gracilis TaxID=150966 RepID=A0AAD3TFI7_NEPGR|nr:hypothetical protein Nepgr_030082 [Nepenthes gracilis]